MGEETTLPNIYELKTRAGKTYTAAMEKKRHVCTQVAKKEKPVATSKYRLYQDAL